MADLCENCLKPLEHWENNEFCSEQCAEFHEQEQTKIERENIKNWRIRTTKELLKQNLSIKEIAKRFRVPENYLLELLEK